MSADPCRLHGLRPGAGHHVQKLLGVRAKLAASQAEFAALLGIPLATLRNWEQRHTMPDGPALALIDLVFLFPRLLSEGHAQRPEA